MTTSKLLRNATGGAFTSRGKHFIRVTTGPQHRQPELAPWATSLEEALARAKEVQALVNRLRAANEGDPEFLKNLVERAAVADEERMAAIGRQVDALLVDIPQPGERVLERTPTGPKKGPVTVRMFGEDWTSGDLHKRFPDHVKKKKTSGGDAQRLENHIYPVVGDVPLALITLEHAQDVMRRLPSTLSVGSRRQYAQLLSKMMHMAAFPAQHIKASPLPRGFLPHAGAEKAKSTLYPKEEARLLACAEVPLAYRMLWGFLAREGMRTGEATALTWSTLDLENGCVELDENKTDDPRSWALDPSVCVALKWWRSTRKDEPADALVFRRPDVKETEDGIARRGRPRSSAVHNLDRSATMFRAHLAVAGVDRPQLTEHGPNRLRIRAHDLRGVFVTYSFVAGRNERWVQDRTGHTTSQMLAKYSRVARKVGELNLGTLVPLADAIPECSATRLQDAAAGYAKASITQDEASTNDDISREIAKADEGDLAFRFRRRKA
jgi:integrase